MTFTKEQLQHIIETDHVQCGDASALARMALAGMEAEPVGYFYADKPGDWYQISDGDRVPSHRRIPLYANPQSSPVVKLPNEFFSSEGIVVQIEKLMAVLAVHGIQYERRGNACRAAMLQGAEPVQGWIPCSDRMPTKNDRVLIFINFNSDTVPPSIHDAQFTGSTFRRGNATVNVFPLEDGYGVTHWMPLPAAPQQEVR
ncbi:DUF551 domain-containing protein [Enterobacter asburiae]|uniref:DUF551 domain-containing protein n=1 Tax=Enterobacter asburiae TaxID=61645 RepID=UPI0020733E91|nr:DUF551 domain-containing protein [Enterobacter asburiae]